MKEQIANKTAELHLKGDFAFGSILFACLFVTFG